jgi:cob(I)alamin adenosyltransferase
MRIYTKTGDSGETGLVGGGRVTKDSLKMKAIGEVDELNACVGLCSIEAKGTLLEETLPQIQDWLFGVGAELATPAGSPISLQSIDQASIDSLEESMDRQDKELEPLRNFILPGGSEGAARFHLARAVCRRAERTAWELNRQEPVRQELLVFLNRLSDWFFMGARTINRLNSVEDIKWARKEQI